jgi:CheY-like chemotaxis protein
MMPRKRILLVEDELIPAIFTKEVLNDLGYDVIDIAVSGEEAFETAKQSSPDLILMDIKLAGNMDGIESAGLISERFNIPVVFLSAHDDGHTKKLVKNDKSYWFIQKPIEEEKLQAVIESALENHNA